MRAETAVLREIVKEYVESCLGRQKWYCKVLKYKHVWETGINRNILECKLASERDFSGLRAAY